MACTYSNYKRPSPLLLPAFLALIACDPLSILETENDDSTPQDAGDLSPLSPGGSASTPSTSGAGTGGASIGAAGGPVTTPLPAADSGSAAQLVAPNACAWAGSRCEQGVTR